jgi:hypothetical protein
MATREHRDPNAAHGGRTPTPDTVAMGNLRSFRQKGRSGAWYTSWWVPITLAVVMLVLLLMVAV